MALTAVAPFAGDPAGPAVATSAAEDEIAEDRTAEFRINLTRPPDRDNDLIKIAAQHGAPGILAVLRANKDYGWFVVLCFRAIEVCVGPRHSGQIAAVQACDPVAFGMQMLELEMIDEVFQLMKYYAHVRDIQHHGLSIIEILIMDDTEWRDEVARRGGCSLLCDVAKQRKDSPSIMNQVMTCMAYLAAEDYIEVMLCQHDALAHVMRILKHHRENTELVTRAALALLNLTACEPHVEELMERQTMLLVLEALDAHPSDVHLVIILMGVLANCSAREEARRLLVAAGVFPRVKAAMLLGPDNAVLQVACLKAFVNYSASAEDYMRMEELEIPNLVGQIMVELAEDEGVQKYGNFFLGHHTSCPIL